jgi:putative phosphatase
MLRLFYPKLKIDSVAELTPEFLASKGIKNLLLDADCTIKKYHSETPTPKADAWLEQMRQAGIGLCLVSNGRGPRISRFAESVNLPFVAPALKPLPFGCTKAVREMGWRKGETAMVGDQLFADILAGRLAGLFTILVEPINPELEKWFTRAKRPLERIVLSQFKPPK